MTQEQIDKAIKNCYWRNTTYVGKTGDEAYAICRGMLTPCLRVIETGKCDTLIELFQEGKQA